ncbi:MAG: riboflavin synthase, partial [Myxococcota bacterium]|nr:riboflavin synthase [Myxococcota bacterium]
MAHGKDHWLWIEAGFPHRPGEPSESLQLGDSVAVNGACLTVVELNGDRFAVQASPETFRRTNLGALKAGDALNLERALRLGDRLGGHLVLGHVDGVGRLRSQRTQGNAVLLEVDAPPALMPMTVEKGSITVDGISLTVNALDETGFSLSIIPYS